MRPLPTETDGYKYEVALAEEDMTVVHVIPTEGRRSSFIGAVFLAPTDEGYETTKAIVCQSKGASKVAPATPILSASGELACSGDAIEP